MLIRSPRFLHYPVTVTELCKKHSDVVSRSEPLFRYTYRSLTREGDPDGNWQSVEKSLIADFESEIDGTISHWKINVGMVLHAPGVDIVEIDEPCQHDTQFGGLCVDCGRDMTEVTYNTSVLGVDRAPILMNHGHTALKVSQYEASRANDVAKKRLLSCRKLSLVVDLDQTIIHATVDPTVLEWQKNPNHPNHAAVKDIKTFELHDEGQNSMRCWYFIKTRPGLQQFLDKISKLYELHIYTMGTRSYAQNIASIIDPDGRLFAERILSRDESGSMTFKTLQRLFPCDTKMVVIIDDRADVWSWCNNLIKVSPYDFFVGIDDINSTFLPQRIGAVSGTVSQSQCSSTNASDTFVQESAIDDETTASIPGCNADTSSDKVSPDAQQISANYPKNSLMDADSNHESPCNVTRGIDGTSSLLPSSVESSTPSHDSDQVRLSSQSESCGVPTPVQSENPFVISQPLQNRRVCRNVLRDDDRELFYLEKHLEKVHQAFFEEYDLLKAIAEVTQSHDVAESQDTLPLHPEVGIVPDIGEIMPSIKSTVLEGVVLVFTGVIQLHINVRLAEISLWAESFGATIKTSITPDTTHVIANKDRRTSKLKQALQIDTIKAVSTAWLLSCFSHWERVDEEPYLITLGLGEPNESVMENTNSNFRNTPDDFFMLSETDESVVSDEDTFLAESGNTPDVAKSDNMVDVPESTDTGSKDTSSTEKIPIDLTEEGWAAMHAEIDEFLGSDVDSQDDDFEEFNVLENLVQDDANNSCSNTVKK